MTRMWRAGLCGAAALLALGMLTGAQADNHSTPTTPRALASNGAVVEMPKLAGLDCAELGQALRRIDLSKYRGPEAVPEDHPDWPIFEYEDRLTKQYYFSCTLGENQLEDPGTAFSFGFESQ